MRKVDTVGWIRSGVGGGGYDEDYQETALADHSAILCLEDGRSILNNISIIFYCQSGNEFARLISLNPFPASILIKKKQNVNVQRTITGSCHFILLNLIIECIQYLNDHGGSAHGERLVSRLY